MIGDLTSTVSEVSAALTGEWKIPQCSCSSGSVQLSNKETYPYFFRTTASVMLYSQSLVTWVHAMGWDTFALIYWNNGVGQQSMHTINNQSYM